MEIKIRNQSQGFTMVELLVVVAIIGLLAMLTLIGINNIKQRSRDAQRVANMKSIQDALAMYQDNYAQFPIYDGAITGEDPMSTALEAENYISSVPADPINALDEGVNYQYYYISEQGNDYIIQFYLETDSVSGMSQGLHSVSP